jgi:hypothetical protein
VRALFREAPTCVDSELGDEVRYFVVKSVRDSATARVRARVYAYHPVGVEVPSERIQWRSGPEVRAGKAAVATYAVGDAAVSVFETTDDPTSVSIGGVACSP